MHIRRRNLFLFSTKISSDIFGGFSGLLLAYYIRFQFISYNIKPDFIPPIKQYIIAFFFLTFSWVLIFYLLGLYHTMKKHYLIDELYDTSKGIFFGILLILLPAFFYRSGSFSRLVLVIGAFFSFFIINIYRYFLTHLIHFFNRKRKGVIRLAIVGGSTPGERIKEIVLKDSEYLLIGQVTEKETETIDGIEILGSSDEIDKIIQEKKIDMLIMAYPLRNSHEATKIIKKSLKYDILLRFLPDIDGLISSRIDLYEMKSMPLLGLREYPLSGINIFIKRFFDIVLSLIAILFLSPVFLFIAIGVKLTSPGPVFFLQERIGKNENKFYMIKYRSMKQDAEKDTGPVYAQEGDPRKTKFGSFIRSFSLDELPQFFNVLKGDMSVIGPRPEMVPFVEKFKNKILRYSERHRVKPGITGWAQANDLRANSSIKERIEYDLYYIENWSWDFDIKILLRTILTLLSHKNAY